MHFFSVLVCAVPHTLALTDCHAWGQSQPEAAFTSWYCSCFFYSPSPLLRFLFVCPSHLTIWLILLSFVNTYFLPVTLVQFVALKCKAILLLETHQLNMFLLYLHNVTRMTSSTNRLCIMYFLSRAFCHWNHIHARMHLNVNTAPSKCIHVRFRT